MQWVCTRKCPKEKPVRELETSHKEGKKPSMRAISGEVLDSA